MKFVLARCVIATTIGLGVVSMTQAQLVDDNNTIFDNLPPSIADNIPPDASQTELQPVRNRVEQQSHEKQPKIRSDLIPFNSKRVDLIEFLQKKPSSVQINGYTVKLKNPERVLLFYQQEQFPTIWTHENQITVLVPQLQHAIGASIEDALNPRTYHQSIIEALKMGVNYQDITALEIMMTDAWLSLAGNLANGLVNPKVTSPTWDAEPVSDAELAKKLADGIINQDVIKPLHEFNEQDFYYQTLKQAYNASRANANTDRYVINMDRLRWMPQDWHKGRYILVNIPAFLVNMVQDGQEIYQTKAVVGRVDRPTPRFTNLLRHVVLAPTWTVPPTIMRKDKLGRLRSNPGSFDGNFEVVTPSGAVVKPSAVNWSGVNLGNYSLRQKPGKNNALGVVKFLFPNKHAIYLHDTPSKGLFNQSYRAKSSGCVRLQKPLELANILLSNTNWSPAKIKTVANSGRQQYVNPPQETPIYLVYWSVWVELNGQIHQAKDVYNLDRKLIDAYKKALVQ